MAKKGGKLRTVYGVFFALLTLFVGGLFIMQAWSIYRSAEKSPYSAESISKHFQEIAIPVWVWLGGLVLTIFLALLFPSEKPRVKATADEKKTLARVKAKLPTEGEIFERAYTVSKRKRSFRVFVWTFTSIFMLAAAVLCALTLLDIYYQPIMQGAFFQKHRALADRVFQVAVLSLATLLVVSLAVELCTHSRKREQKKYLALLAESKRPPVAKTPVVEEKEETPAPIEEATPTWETIIRSIVAKDYFHEAVTEEEIIEEILRLIGAKEGVNATLPPCQEAETVVFLPPQTPEKAKKIKQKKPLVKPKKERKSHPKARKRGVIIARVVLAVAGVGLIAFGVFNGGMQDVLMKAINICTQCIGLG